MMLPLLISILLSSRPLPATQAQFAGTLRLRDRKSAVGVRVGLMVSPMILRQKAKVRLDPNSGQPLLTLTLSDGSSITENPTAVRGTAENPMTRGEVVEKARDLMQPILGVSATTRLIERLLDFENIRSVRELRPLAQRA